jgi:GxxExxY protein
VAVPVMYKGLKLRLAYRLDLVVEHSVVVEVKAVDRLHPLTDAQVLTYLKLTSLRRALILNFNVGLLRDGVRRLVL